MIKLISMSVQELRDTLETMKPIILNEIGIGKGTLEFLEERLEHKTLIAFAFNLGLEIDFLKNNRSLVEIGQRILMAQDSGIERTECKNFRVFEDKINCLTVRENTVEELEILGLCYLLEGLKCYFNNDIYILLEIESKFTNFTKNPSEAIKLLLDLQKESILLDDVEKYFEEKLSLEERQNLEKIMKKYKDMEL